MVLSLRSRYAFLKSQKGFGWSLVWGLLLCAVGLPSPLFMKPHLLAVTAGVEHGPDFILDLLPAVTTFGIAVWGPLLITILFLITLIYHPWFAPIALKAIGILFLVRAFSIILTPLGLRSDQYALEAQTFLQSISYIGNDYVFSGHVAFPFLLSLMYKRNRNLHNLFLIAALIMSAAVLIEHIHYSIDVFVAPFMAYGIWKLCERYLTKDMGYVRAAHAEFHMD